MAVKAGQEIDAYCTKCKMDLLHRIVAVVGVKPVKVECRTCYTVHLYRAPKSASAQSAPAASRSSSGAAAPAARPAARRERAPSPEDHISLEPPSGSRVHPYRMTEQFMKDQWMQHKTFGIGLVVGELGTDKIEVRFESGLKVLVHNRAE